MAKKLSDLTDALFLSSLTDSVVTASPLGEPSVGNWVRMLRFFFRMTQGELAEKAKLSQSHIAAIESNKIEPQITTLRKIFDALECDLLVRPKPRKPLTELLRDRARPIALRRLNHSMGTMALEQQAPDPEMFKRLLEKRTDEMVNDKSQRLRDTEL